MKTSKGPFIARPQDYHTITIVDADKVEIARVLCEKMICAGSMHVQYLPIKQAQANANLLAASHELLEALEAVMDERWRASGMGEDVADKARAAISKAKGDK